VKALTALWEYRENCRMERGLVEDVPNARQRLSAIVERLGGAALPSFEGVDTPSSTAKDARPDPALFVKLETDFIALHALDAQPRGYAFEKFLTDLFNVWKMDARCSFKIVGEQIDGSFQHDGATYLVEAKWQSSPTNAATLHAFQGKVEERPQWTRGLFVSYEGFSEQALKAFTARRIIMMDGMDLYDALRRRIPLPSIITEKARYAAEYKQPFERVRTLFPD
jgi:hypothetical protein